MVTLHIQVKAGSKQNEITTPEPGKIVVKVKAPATEGKANKELIQFLSQQLKVPKSKITILKGANAPFKTIEIDAEPGTLQHLR
ncbi:MAG: DUF167 domain-containing protein [Chitinophagales bacterium]|nr:DUF167 domain-containing protein [Chitinophagales bacterium]